MLDRSKRPVMPETGSVRLEDDFFLPFMSKVLSVSVPDILSKFESVGALENYRRLIDGRRGECSGPPFLHALICECIRGISDLLVFRRDDELEKRIDGYIYLMVKAFEAEPDGYFNPYVTLIRPGRRFGKNGGDVLGLHETYLMGALAEAGVHYYRATRKKALLALAVRN